MKEPRRTKEKLQPPLVHLSRKSQLHRVVDPSPRNHQTGRHVLLRKRKTPRQRAESQPARLEKRRKNQKKQQKASAQKKVSVKAHHLRPMKEPRRAKEKLQPPLVHLSRKSQLHRVVDLSPRNHQTGRHVLIRKRETPRQRAESQPANLE